MISSHPEFATLTPAAQFNVMLAYQRWAAWFGPLACPALFVLGKPLADLAK